MPAQYTPTYREQLNAWQQRATDRAVEFDDTDLGKGGWKSIVLINGVSHGGGISATKNRAHEGASYWALVKLGVVVGPPEADFQEDES
ncbi:hypothetical protein CYLTODRAFT_448426 [Cylindrobasidium torrendii FP15055 ss-10]|uniref:DRBM domain-containing protein n=1 Tax=Cylindrobasidium torrendii FP15055 ss-10 TaxID=1314674 RepID=A0A0D7BUA3_9AGAR|nr:hypothetical protein CYLTODRAFT_448426 [Cylindrobasidium torrendii FP15055 ss-10]